MRTVRELIALLQGMDPDAYVLVNSDGPIARIRKEAEAPYPAPTFVLSPGAAARLGEDLAAAYAEPDRYADTEDPTPDEETS